MMQAMAAGHNLNAMEYFSTTVDPGDRHPSC
jgi:hypothetical protein